MAKKDDPSLLDFIQADEKRRRNSPTESWFDARPEIKEEVIDALINGAAVKTTQRWLREYKEFPFGPDAFADWVAKQG